MKNTSKFIGIAVIAAISFIALVLIVRPKPDELTQMCTVF